MQHFSLKQKALTWANRFEVCCYLDSNGYQDCYSKYDCLIAVGAIQELWANTGNGFEQLKHFYNANKSWIFGLFGYDLKNETEQLNPPGKDLLDFPDLYFFIPQFIITVTNNTVSCLKGETECIREIENTPVNPVHHSGSIKIKNKMSKSVYIQTVEKLKEHIKRGDIYEINFCQEFYADQADIDPLSVYRQLKAISPSPFSGYFKFKNRYILSVTPERFIGKRKNKIISQPIKGTAKRSLIYQQDEKIKKALQNNIKERAENVMIVDLVRNDLTKSALKGSVTVNELFGIYSFPQVHQMISTISCDLNPEVHVIDAIKNAFPMGSMTGAPKFKAMQLIDSYEHSKRGAYSGSFGFFSPDGDFDFNVIIRSILYNKKQKYLSFQVGGAITYASDAKKEYNECLLKASAIMQVLKNKE